MTIISSLPRSFSMPPFFPGQRKAKETKEWYFKKMKLFFCITLAAGKSLVTENPIRTKLLASISCRRYETPLQSYTQVQSGYRCGFNKFCDLPLSLFMSGCLSGCCSDVKKSTQYFKTGMLVHESCWNLLKIAEWETGHTTAHLGVSSWLVSRYLW